MSIEYERIVHTFHTLSTANRYTLASNEKRVAIEKICNHIIQQKTLHHYKLNALKTLDRDHVWRQFVCAPWLSWEILVKMCEYISQIERCCRIRWWANG